MVVIEVEYCSLCSGRQPQATLETIPRHTTTCTYRTWMGLERKISQGIREASKEEDCIRSYETTTPDNGVPGSPDAGIEPDARTRQIKFPPQHQVLQKDVSRDYLPQVSRHTPYLQRVFCRPSEVRKTMVIVHLKSVASSDTRA